jgi:glyoxylase-like metal-dependent hydrolase (beta-lactamase superfamily II)
MKVKLTGYANTCAFFFLTLMSGLFRITMPTVQAEEVEGFINKLQLHYKKTQTITAFSMTHNYLYLGHNAAYSAWDYQAPNRYTAFKVTEFDLEQEHYFENVIHHYPGARKLDEVHFQNNTNSFRYAKNGLPYGKRIVKQSMDDYQGFKELILANVDFFAVRPLLKEINAENTNTMARITIHQDKVSRKTTLIHQSAEGKVVEYVFGESPLRLLSLNNQSAGRHYFYDDYQTTNGITFARAIVQYTHGDLTPTFIKRIAGIDVIKEIEPTKLEIPKGYGPIIPKRDRALAASEIASNLYLVTDSSAWRNTLFSITGDEIMVFGAPISEKLAEQTIELIHGQFPNKKITSVYVTHPHSDHIAGLSVYAKRGVMILADAYSVAAIKAYPPFANNIATFTFQTIEHDQIIDGVRFYVLENAHSKQQSFAYFKDSGILYQADFLEVAFDNNVAKELPSYTKTFIDFVRSKQLKLNRIVGHHNNNNIPVELMNEIYDAHM